MHKGRDAKLAKSIGGQEERLPGTADHTAYLTVVDRDARLST